MLNLKTNLTEAITGLDKLGRHVNNYVIRGGSQAMAQLFYDEARLNAPVAEHGHWFYGAHQKYFFSAGTLKASIYQVFSTSRSREAYAVYQVSWNHKKCPYGFMVEYGTSRAGAHPFMRPAWVNMQSRVAAAARQRMAELLRSGQGALF
jgi:HK97 gp10 family phage protein